MNNRIPWPVPNGWKLVPEEQAEGPVPEPPLCEEIDLIEYMLEQRAYKARLLKEGEPFFASSKFDEELKSIIRAAWEEDNQSPGRKD